MTKMSLQSKSIFNLAIQATAAVAGNTFVSATGATASAGAAALGVAYTDAAVGNTFTVSTVGTATVLAGAAITNGAAVEVDASGRAIPHASGVVVGYALSTASAAGSYVEVFLTAK